MGLVARLGLGSPASWMGCCVAPQPEGRRTGSEPAGRLTRGEYRTHVQEMEQERRRRDEEFAQRKAERAAMRCRMRERYHLQQDERDRGHLRAAARPVQLPPELSTIARTERGASLVEGFSRTARDTVNRLRRSAPCPLM